MTDELSRERIAELREACDYRDSLDREAVDGDFYARSGPPPIFVDAKTLRPLLDAYEAPRWTHNEDICREHRLELARIADRHREARDCLLALVREIARSGVELDDQRLGYVTVQIDRETWQAIRERDDG